MSGRRDQYLTDASCREDALTTIWRAVNEKYVLPLQRLRMTYE